MKTIVFRDGTEKTVTGELGKYWLIGEARVRKLRRDIAEVRELPDETPDGNPTEETAEPKKKPRKKKKEEAPGGVTDGERGE